MKWSDRSRQASLFDAVTRLLMVFVLIGIGYIGSKVCDGIERFGR
jgi:hypothetical protein